MSEKRMFSKSIVLSDAFLDMPPTTRCLYFTLSMLADDDGFVNSPKSIMRQSGASEDDLKLLFVKKFVIPFESGIVVIKHWQINNYLRSDRYKPTKYIDEKSELITEPNGAYRRIEQAELIPAEETSAEEAPAEAKKPKRVSLAEREPKNDIEKVEKVYLENYAKLYERGILKLEKPVINWNASRKLTKDCISKYGVETIVSAVKKSIDNKFVVSKGYGLTMILSAVVLSQLINATDGRIDNDSVNVGEITF